MKRVYCLIDFTVPAFFFSYCIPKLTVPMRSALLAATVGLRASILTLLLKTQMHAASIDGTLKLSVSAQLVILHTTDGTITSVTCSAKGCSFVTESCALLKCVLGIFAT